MAFSYRYIVAVGWDKRVTLFPVGIDIATLFTNSSSAHYLGCVRHSSGGVQATESLEY